MKVLIKLNNQKWSTMPDKVKQLKDWFSKAIDIDITTESTSIKTIDWSTTKDSNGSDYLTIEPNWFDKNISIPAKNQGYKYVIFGVEPKIWQGKQVQGFTTKPNLGIQEIGMVANEFGEYMFNGKIYPGGEFFNIVRHEFCHAICDDLGIPDNTHLYWTNGNLEQILEDIKKALENRETKTYKKLKDRVQNNFPTSIVVHHSGADHNQTVQSIEDYHFGLGWDGVGYQYLITYTGEVWRGRPEHINGAHTAQENMNFKSIGICLIGNFSTEMPSEAQKEALTRLLKDINGRYPIKEIVPHRKYVNKDCFGTKLPDDWASKLLENDTIVIEEMITVQIPKSKMPVVKVVFGILGIKI